MNQETEDSSPRESKLVFEHDKIIYILTNYLLDKKLYLKGYRKKVPANIKIQGNNLLKVFLPFDYQINKTILLYGVAKRYIEFELKYIKTEGIGRHLFEPVKALIATSARKNNRFHVTDKSIIANSFRILSNEEILDSSTPPVSVIHILEEYQRILEPFYPSVDPLYPNVEINSFNERDELINLVYRTKKILFLENTQDKKSYLSENEEEVINLEILLEDKLQNQMNDFKVKEIGTILIYPIIYRRYEKKDIPFAYIKIWFEKPGTIEISGTLAHLNFTIYEMINKIRNSLMTNLKVDQDVINIGLGGIKLLISSPELKKYFMNNEELFINLQHKISDNLMNLTFQCKIVSTVKEKDGNLMVGFSFTGEENKGFEKLNKYLDEC